MCAIFGPLILNWMYPLVTTRYINRLFLVQHTYVHIDKRLYNTVMLNLQAVNVDYSDFLIRKRSWNRINRVNTD